MSRDMRMRPRPREHRPKPRTWPPLTPAQKRFFRQLLDELDTQPQTGRHAQEDQ